MRRNAENSAAGDNAPATSAAAANSGSGNNPATPQTNPRVIVPGINPLPQNRMQQNQRDQVSNHIFHSFIYLIYKSRCPAKFEPPKPLGISYLKRERGGGRLG
jgi:hypothetical protein